MMGQEPAQTTSTKKTLGQKIGPPIMWFGLGMLTIKLIDAYTENKKTKRLTQ